MEILVRQITLSLALGVGLVFCEPPLNNQYGPPGNFPGGGGGNNNNQHGLSSHGGGGGGGGGGGITNSYGAPLDNGHNPDQDYIDSQPKSYEFGYAVKDTATGNDFGRSETSDGETVRGEYRVQLPDGRTQIVTYTADWRTGFHADVRYEGEATFPDQYTNNNNNNNNNGYSNNNNNNNGFSNNNGYSNNNNNGYNNGGGYDSNQNYNNYNRGNQGGYNYNNGNSGNYNPGNNYNGNSNNNYQYTGSNSIEPYNGGGYTGSSGGSNFGGSPTYGTPNFH